MKEIKITEGASEIRLAAEDEFITGGASKISVAEPGEFTTGGVATILQMQEPEWGEKIAFGTFLGEEQWVMRPLNRVAASLMESSHMVAIMMFDRVKELEEAIARMESILEDAGIL